MSKQFYVIAPPDKPTEAELLRGARAVQGSPGVWEVPYAPLLCIVTERKNDKA